MKNFKVKFCFHFYSEIDNCPLVGLIFSKWNKKEIKKKIRIRCIFCGKEKIKSKILTLN